MATSAQIAFFDLAYTDENGDIVMAATPNMDSAYYQVAYDAGARIHSDSWGYDVFEYDAETKEIDQYARDTPDFLPFFAAGNSGDYGLGSITTPAGGKICSLLERRNPQDLGMHTYRPIGNITT